jgi:hypothetical protein
LQEVKQKEKTIETKKFSLELSHKPPSLLHRSQSCREADVFVPFWNALTAKTNNVHFATKKREMEEMENGKKKQTFCGHAW